MPARVSEALILRTYPLGEADLIVSFFTRDQGKLRGVARRARRPKSQFGASLERLAHVRVHYYQPEQRELVRLSSCELIQSQFELAASYATGVTLDYVAEVSEQLLPPGEQNERFFRLLLLVLEYLRRWRDAAVWPAVTYYTLWAVRLSGFLPQLRLSEQDQRIQELMLKRSLLEITPEGWSRSTGADLRRALIRCIEQHTERPLVTLPYLESVSP